MEKGKVQKDEFLDLSAKGTLWITFCYIDRGYLDLVEADLIKDVTSRDFYGSLFENTLKTLSRLVELGEYDRATAVFKAAIEHRYQAVKDEASHIANYNSEDHAAQKSSEWLHHYIPALKEIIEQYQQLLTQTEQMAPDIESINKALVEIDKVLSKK